MRANRGGGGEGSTGGGGQREGARSPGSRTDRGNQNDEDIGSSASRGGGRGEINAPRGGNPADLDPMLDTTDHFGTGSRSSGNPDVTGTTDDTGS
jgi:hypothetical protein